jgi:uracil-DNA glycosylase
MTTSTSAKDIRFSELRTLFKRAEFNINKLKTEGVEIYPPENQIMSAFTYFQDLTTDVRVVIVGQDPYIKSGQAHGLSFSVRPGVDIPPSLRNIFKELESDLGIKNQSGCLSTWAEQGVLLLNRVLTVEEGKSKSHSNQGWEDFTNGVIKYLNDFSSNIVFLLWGKDAQQLSKLIDDNHEVLTSSHPSPLSAHRGFLGCKHFSRTNELLVSKGLEPINWST